MTPTPPESLKSSRMGAAHNKKKVLINEYLLRLISGYLSSQGVSTQVLSAYTSLTTVFGMGTGGSS